MRKKKARAIVKAHLDGMCSALRLNEWSIDIVWGLIGDGEDLALCKPDPAYRRATISIDYDQHEGKAQLLNTLRHELIHILHAEMETFRQATYQILERREEWICNRVWHRACEDVCRNIEGMLDELGFGPKELAAKGKIQ